MSYSDKAFNIEYILDTMNAQKDSDNIPVFKPLIEKEELARIVEALAQGWLGMGSYVGELEANLKEYLKLDDHKRVICVNTGHSANHLAMVLAGLGPGDEVITPSFNNVSDFQAIRSTGAEPVFCDVDLDTLCIDLDSAEKLVNENTKMIIAMDYALVLCDHDAVNAFGKKHGIRVLHDAAHSFGFEYKGKMVGNISDFTMMSFDPIKNMTGIDAGVLIVNSEEEYERAVAMRYLGTEQNKEVLYTNQRSWTHDVKDIGYRYHLANSHAAIALENFKKIDVIKSSRIAACELYHELLKDLDGTAFALPKVDDYHTTIPFIFYLLVKDDKRDELRAFLKTKNIDSGVHWQPGHWFTAFKNCKHGDLTITETIGNEIMSIPLFSKITEDEVRRSAAAVLEFFAK